MDNVSGKFKQVQDFVDESPKRKTAISKESFQNHQFRQMFITFNTSIRSSSVINIWKCWCSWRRTSFIYSESYREENFIFIQRYCSRQHIMFEHIIFFKFWFWALIWDYIRHKTFLFLARKMVGENTRQGWGK